MTSSAAKPVVVGIDGSRQSAQAALWAVEQAVRRGVPLRLVYVIRTDLKGSLTAEEYRSALDDAKLALHSVRSELEAAGQPAVVQTEIQEGSPAGVLLAESPYATMICVGSSGIGRMGRAILGSTAVTVAESASCSVAIIRSPQSVAPVDDHTKWVMVPVSVFTHNDVVDTAIDQARLLRRPVLAVGVRRPDLGSTPYDALDNLVAQWQEQYPDVHIYPVSEDTTMSGFLDAHPDMAGSVVIDAGSASEVAALIGSVHHARRDDAERAVIVARNYVNASAVDASLASPST